MKNATLLFFREGNSLYTNQFPDLTHEGIKKIGRTAEEIYKIVGARTSIKLVSDPSISTMGSSRFVANRLGYPFDLVVEEPAIRCMDSCVDEKTTKDFFAQFSSPEALDYAYSVDRKFESGLIVERRSDVKHRFDLYLGGVFKDFVKDKNFPQVVIYSLRFEVIHNLALPFEFKKPVQHGEVVKMDLSYEGGQIVNINGFFRGERKDFFCNPCNPPGKIIER